MASTEDYLSAINQARSDKKSVGLDFSAIGPEVDRGALESALSNGLPEEYAAALSGASKSNKKIKLDYSQIEIAQPIPEIEQASQEPIAGESAAQRGTMADMVGASFEKYKDIIGSIAPRVQVKRLASGLSNDMLGISSQEDEEPSMLEIAQLPGGLSGLKGAAVNATEELYATKISDAIPPQPGITYNNPDMTIGDMLEWFSEPSENAVNLKTYAKQVLPKVLSVDPADIVGDPESFKDQFSNALISNFFLPSVFSDEQKKLVREPVDMFIEALIPESRGAVLFDIATLGLPKLLSIASKTTGATAARSRALFELRAKLESTAAGEQIIENAKLAGEARAGANTILKIAKKRKDLDASQIELPGMDSAGIVDAKSTGALARKIDEGDITPEVFLESLDRPIDASSSGASKALAGSSADFIDFVSSSDLPAIPAAALKAGQSQAKRQHTKEVVKSFFAFVNRRRAAANIKKRAAVRQQLASLNPDKDSQWVSNMVGGLAGAKKRRARLVSGFDTTIGSSSRAVLKKMGSDGVELANRADAAHLAGVELAGDIGEKVKRAMEGLSDAQLGVISRYFDASRKATVSAQELATVSAPVSNINKAFAELRAAAAKAGDKDLAESLRGDFLKHIYNLDDQDSVDLIKSEIINSPALKKVKLDSAGDSVIERHKVAETILANYKSSVRAEPHGIFDDANSLTQYLNTSLYEKDPRVALDAIIQSSAHRIERAKKLGGPGYGFVEDTLKKLDVQGFDHRTAKQIMDSELYGTQSGSGVLEGGLKRAAGEVRALNTFLMMGNAQVKNILGSANTVGRTNIGNVYEAIKSMRSEAGSERVFRILDHSVHQAIRDNIAASTGADVSSLAGRAWMSFRGSADKLLQASGFKSVEVFNRQVAGRAGVFHAKELAQALFKTQGAKSEGEFAMRRLTELIPSIKGKKGRIEAILKNGKLTQKEEVEAGLRVIADSQFEGRTLDLPLFWKSDVGKSVFQFKTFQYRHAVFIKDQIAREARLGNYKPLRQFAAVATASGYTANQVHGFVTGRGSEDDKTALGALFDAWATAGGLGIWLSASMELLPELEGRKFQAAQAVGNLAGPTAGLGVKAVELGHSMIFDDAGGIAQKSAVLAPAALRNIPKVGPALPIVSRLAEKEIKSQRKIEQRKQSLRKDFTVEKAIAFKKAKRERPLATRAISATVGAISAIGAAIGRKLTGKSQED